MALRCRPATIRGMGSSYGVVWRNGDHRLATGKLELLTDRLRLDGLADDHAARCDLPYASLLAVRVGRAVADRINSSPTVVLERRAGPPIVIAAVGRPSLAGEIAERVEARRREADS